MRISRSIILPCAFAACLLSSTGCARQPGAAANAHKTGAPSWTFVVSGDSRNCGNIVMPAIAAGARADHATFYWHLGDLRAIYKMDEDYVLERRFRSIFPPPGITDYVHTAWTDFLQHQVVPFGDMPFFIGIGNHEIYVPKSRTQFLIDFLPLLNRDELREQRERDAALYKRIGHAAAPRTYYHWTMNGVEFINLDNATDDSFDVAQLVWFDAIIEADRADPKIKTIVVGMHESLPYSKTDSHSMCGSLSGREGGKHVYGELVKTRRAAGKNVYLLSSHSHYYLENIFDTEHWRDPANDSIVLPGWVVGTAGAVRYPLPADVQAGPGARENTYGYLLGQVKADATIAFTFHELGETQLQAARGSDYGPEDVTFCLTQNPDPETFTHKRSQPLTCEQSMVR